MRRNVISHPYKILDENVNELLGMDFVFIAIDKGEARKLIASYLQRHNSRLLMSEWELMSLTKS